MYSFIEELIYILMSGMDQMIDHPTHMIYVPEAVLFIKQ